MAHAQLVDVCNFMPDRVVRNSELEASAEDDLKDVADSDFFKGVSERRFASPEYSSADLGIAAAKRLLKRTGVAADSLDLVITSCVLTDLMANGIGAAVVRGLDAAGANFLNLDTNCTSWVTSLNTARAYITAGLARRVLLVTATNFVSRLPDYGKQRASWTLGDGASASLVVADTRDSMLGYYEKTSGEMYGHMRLEPEAAGDGQPPPYWSRSDTPLTVNFSQQLLDLIQANATENIPLAVRGALTSAGLETDDVDLLITHQPNQTFLDRWRDALGIFPPRAFDTLDRYGNLFMGSLPVTLGEACQNDRLSRGDIVALATFANAGDHVTACVLRW